MNDTLDFDLDWYEIEEVATPEQLENLRSEFSLIPDSDYEVA